MTDFYTNAIESVLEDFNIDAKVTGQTTGPSVTRYEIEVGKGVRMEAFEKLSQNFAYATAAESVRVLAPIPGKAAVGIELPSAKRKKVTLKTLPKTSHPLEVGIGVDIEGVAVTANLGKLPHLLVAGTTGSGKSCFINSLLVNLIKRDSDEVKLLLIDPKMVELTPYNGIPHLIQPVVTEAKAAVAALESLVEEMERRYKAMQDNAARSIEGMGFAHIVVVVDELADLMMTAKKPAEDAIVRLAQKARAAGIHLILATQRPTVDVVTGMIKANVPSRLAFATSSLTDSRVILDEGGAEQLLGEGDGLFKPVGARASRRIQAAYVSDDEVDAAVIEATVTGRVERMVNELNPEPGEYLTVIDLLNDMIQHAERARDNVDDYQDKLVRKDKHLIPFTHKGKKKTELLLQAPVFIGEAHDALTRLAYDLRVLRDNSLRTLA